MTTDETKLLENIKNAICEMQKAIESLFKTQKRQIALGEKMDEQSEQENSVAEKNFKNFLKK